MIQKTELNIIEAFIVNMPFRSHKSSVIIISRIPTKEICFTFLDLYILYNCGKYCTEVKIGANTATILSNIL
jgi:hypothetical protein